MAKKDRYKTSGFSVNKDRKLKRNNTAMMKKFHLKNGNKVAFLTAKQIADICHVSKKTAYRWMKHGKIPEGYKELLNIKALGTIPTMENYTIKDGLIKTRTGHTLTGGDLDMYSLVLASLWHDKSYQHLFLEIESANDGAVQYDWIDQAATLDDNLRSNSRSCNI